ncbi:MAG TPA: hypothetical protein VFD43_10185 [Planctomycetota bacterium]|nr:hypothetical protein [Planctomycetota bacterium]
MKRPAGKLPPYPTQWKCVECGRGGLTVQHVGELRALACRFCEQVRCQQCDLRHYTGGEFCQRAAASQAGAG